MLSEEEKKAITNLIDLVKFWKKNNVENSNDEILLNLIDKQQKEIEKLEKNKKLFLNYEKRVNELEREIAINSISKDKIREIFKKYSEKEECTYKELIDFVEEIKRQGNTREIEEEFIEKNYISKEKIRENIKELEGQEDWYIEHKSLDDLYGRIDELKQLLEE